MHEALPLQVSGGALRSRSRGEGFVHRIEEFLPLVFAAADVWQIENAIEFLLANVCGYSQKARARFGEVFRLLAANRVATLLQRVRNLRVESSAAFGEFGLTLVGCGERGRHSAHERPQHEPANDELHSMRLDHFSLSFGLPSSSR